MKKAFLSALFVLVGSVMWWTLANTVRFSVKKWDAKFNTVLTHSLDELGIKDQDINSSVNEVVKDKNGDYVVRRLSVLRVDKKKRAELTRALEKSGAQVTAQSINGTDVLTVRRGSRIYQEITFLKS